MKQTYCFAVLILAVFALFSFSNSQPLISPKPDDIVLEIVSTTSEMVYPKGDILIMRLYQSGRFEYDDYPDYQKSSFSCRLYGTRRPDSDYLRAQSNQRRTKNV